jgi:hypothetical protein
MTNAASDRIDLTTARTSAQERVAALRAELATCTTAAQRHCVMTALEAACGAYLMACRAVEEHDDLHPATETQATLSEAAEQVLSAAQMLGEGGKRVHLRTLNECIALSRESRDAALVELMDAGRLVCYRNDYTRGLTKYDHAAALIVGGEPRHVAYLV